MASNRRKNPISHPTHFCWRPPSLSVYKGGMNLRDASKSLLNRLAALGNAVAISNREYTELHQHRTRAVLELTTIENRTLKPGLSGVVFSKDRALQIHALL